MFWQSSRRLHTTWSPRWRSLAQRCNLSSGRPARQTLSDSWKALTHTTALIRHSLDHNAKNSIVFPDADVALPCPSPLHRCYRLTYCRYSPSPWRRLITSMADERHSRDTHQLVRSLGHMLSESPETWRKPSEPNLGPRLAWPRGNSRCSLSTGSTDNAEGCHF